uniref:Uncharacterized protein LOC114343778 n=1 Tax=Diabrotica virgifera virgifera TaxID=50390 RepID=A0A6P7GYB6_DIAVI
MAAVSTKDQLHSWIQRSIGTEHFTDYVQNTTQNYVVDIFFVKIDLQPINGKDVLYLVLKTNKKSSGQEKCVFVVQGLCKREVFFYGTILKEYQEFQSDQKLPILLDMVPNCYKTFLENDNEVIILENLKKEGYVLHSREEPMNILHLEMGLKSYAKLHAMSFALKDQKRDIFENMSKNCSSLIREVFVNLKTMYDTKSSALVETLKEAGRPDLSIVYKKYINDKSIHNRIMEVWDTISKDQAFSHTDCHNANMMFQYKVCYKQFSDLV